MNKKWNISNKKVPGVNKTMNTIKTTLKWNKIFLHYKSDKRLMAKIYKILIKLNNNNKNKFSGKMGRKNIF